MKRSLEWWWGRDGRSGIPSRCLDWCWNHLSLFCLEQSDPQWFAPVPHFNPPPKSTWLGGNNRIWTIQVINWFNKRWGFFKVISSDSEEKHAGEPDLTRPWSGFSLVAKLWNYNFMWCRNKPRSMSLFLTRCFGINPSDRLTEWAVFNWLTGFTGWGWGGVGWGCSWSGLAYPHLLLPTTSILPPCSASACSPASTPGGLWTGVIPLSGGRTWRRWRERCWHVDDWEIRSASQTHAHKHSYTLPLPVSKNNDVTDGGADRKIK